jgi:hypothetical protein
LVLEYYFGIINNITNYYGIENDRYVKIELNVSERTERSYIINFINYFNNEINDSEYPAYYERDKTENNSRIYYIYIPFTAELLIIISKKIINLNNNKYFTKKYGYKSETQNIYLKQIEETIFNIMKDKYLLNLNDESKSKFKEFFNYFINVERQKYKIEGNTGNKFNESINSVWNNLFGSSQINNKVNATELPATQTNLEDKNAMEINAMEINAMETNAVNTIEMESNAKEIEGEEIEASSPEKIKRKIDSLSPVKKKKKSQQDEEENRIINENTDIQNYSFEDKDKNNNNIQKRAIYSPVKNKVINTFTSKNKRKRTGGVKKTYKNKK